jgi:hypothetical protein
MSGATVRERGEGYRRQVRLSSASTDFPAGLRPAIERFCAVLEHFGDHLYHCYDTPGLPRTNNALEQFYRRVKATERRITGHRRSDNFVVRMGGFAADALATVRGDEAALLSALAHVPASDWLAERQTLRTIQERQTQMRRFRLHRDAYLADLQARWAHLHDAGPP